VRRPSFPPLVVAVAIAAGSASGAADPADGLARSGLVERSSTHLAQVDVTISGPPDVIAYLTRDDFKLKVNLTKIQQFEVDRLCAPPELDPARKASSTAGPRPSAPISYLFYFEQAHLTLAGRARAVDVAKSMAPRLLQDGSRAMLVSNAGRFKVVQNWTTDPDVLIEAIKRLEADRSQWQFYAEEEATHVDEVASALNQDETLSRAVNLARFYQREELWRTDKSLRRLAMSLAMLADALPPKAVVYFADTLRDNPGEHYLSFFATNAKYGGAAWVLSTDSLLAKHPFDIVVNEAVAQSIRFYPVLAEGLVTDTDLVVASGRSVGLTGTIDSSSRMRRRHAQDTLANLAAETGGHAFIHGDRPSRISKRILTDFSCVYLISFDPGEFARDAPLRVVIRSTRDDVTVHARGRVVLESDATRTATRLLNAFLVDTGGDGISGLSANLVPSAFVGGKYTALLQISLPGTMLPAASWTLGASVVARDKVRAEVSGQLAVSQAGVPIVLEQEVRLGPGLHEIVAVAQEASSGFVLSDRRDVSWPDPDDQAATCGPIAVLQPTPGAFLRDGITRTEGSLARAMEEPLDSELPTALMGLVCRGRKRQGRLLVERTLTGESRVVFPPLEFELDKDRCAQIRDVIPAGVLGPGAYRYSVRAIRDERALDETSRDFHVAARAGVPDPGGR